MFPATPFEASFYESNPSVRRYGKIVRFSTIGAVKAGWLVKEKGHWSLTEEGRNAYAKFSDPEAFYVETSRLYRAGKRLSRSKSPILVSCKPQDEPLHRSGQVLL